MYLFASVMLQNKALYNEQVLVIKLAIYFQHIVQSAAAHDVLPARVYTAFGSLALHGKVELIWVALFSLTPEVLQTRTGRTR